ncbi:TIGR04388 family protein, partial [Leptospira adleri]
MSLGKTLFYFFSLFGICLFFRPAYAQPVVVPNLNSPVFNTNSMNQTFTVANGMQTVGNWDAFVFQSVSILQTQWEAQVQAQITMMVNSITTSDHFASVQDYQAYVHNSLESQASEQLIVWQSAVEGEILQERSQFLTSKFGANSAAVQNSTATFQSQWDSFLNGSGLNLNLSGAISQAVLNSGQQTLQGLESQWWSDFNSNLQSGLFTYQQAVQNLTTQYQNLISQINATEMQYQQNLAQIQQSQSNVKDQVFSSLQGYQSFLNGNGLFWNTISVLYDNSSNSYVQASCPGGHVCNTFQYDPSNSQFYAFGSCPSGHTCANVLYDTTTSSYLQNTVCPSVCNGTESENLVIRTGLNADGRAFQNVINNAVNALQEGFIMPAIFDYTTGTMLSYNNNCLNGNSCVKGLFDSTSGTFVSGNTCSSGHTCFSAVVDNTAGTGSYFMNTCPVGDTRCVSCASGHTCQVQDMEAGLLYASSAVRTFLHNELVSTQGALQNAINFQNSGNTSYSVRYGQTQGAYNNAGIWSYGDPIFSHTPFNHFAASAGGPASVSISEILNGGIQEGEGGLAKKIMAYVRNQITQSDLANWIMDAYESGLSGSGSPLSGLTGLGPGMTITGFNQVDLRAFMNEDNHVPFLNFTPYCGSGIGCVSGDIFNWTSGIYLANRTFSEMIAQNLAGTQGPWGQNFYDYFAREAGVWNNVPFLADIQHQQDYAWIELNFSVTNNNAYANVTTYQDLVLQLQSFEYDWQNNVMPSITNWTAQAASYQAQYANWQIQMQSALANAQSLFNSGIQDIQSQESSWLAQMNQVQQQAQNAFNTAQNALQNGQGQGNYQQLTQQVLAQINKGRVHSGDGPSNVPDFQGFGSSILSGLDRNANQNIPNFALLENFGRDFNRLITGASNLSLLSSTNNSTMDTVLGFMKGIADSMKNEKQFTQNGFSDLVQASGIKTKEVETKNAITGETETTTYVLKADGTIDTFVDKDGKTKQKTLGAWVSLTCGDDLSNGNCNPYIENKYESVDVSKDGKITAHRKIYDGTSSYCGSNATDSHSYCYGTEDAVVTIDAPPKDMILLGRGASRLGDIFDDRSKGFNDLVDSTFQNVNAYLSSNKHTAGLFSQVNMLQNVNDRNSNLASQDVGNKVKIANLIVDYVESVLTGGMSTSAWVTKQANQAVQDAVATVIARTFDLPPDVAAFLSGGLMANLEMSKAKHELGTKNLGIGKGIQSAFHDVGLEGVEKGMLKIFPALTSVMDAVIPGMGTMTKASFGSTLKSYENDLDAIDRWKDFKNSMYGFTVQKVAIANGMSPAAAGALAQYASDYMEMRHAKAELGMRSGMFSLQGIGGTLQRAIGDLGGMVMEGVGGVVRTGAHFSGDLGLVSEKHEKQIAQDFRSAINDIRLKEYKDDIRNWDSDQVMLASESVKELGRIEHWDQAKIDLWSQQASDFVVRKQAERDLHRRNDLINITAITNPVSAFMFLDNKLFSGGLTSLATKGVKGLMTSIADLGNMLGESIVSSDFKSSIYDQSKEWSNTVTMGDVKARSQQGIINKAYIENDMRNKMFDLIGEALMPGDPNAAHVLGLLLKDNIDKHEAKKHAREQRLKDAETIVQVAAAAAAIYFTAGAAAGSTGSWLSSVAVQTGTTTTASLGGVSTVVATGVTNGQLIAMGVSTAVNMAIEGSLNGTNGALAAFANGLISTATLGVKTPITGYLTYSKHENANLLTGQHEVKGGWGGGVNLNISGAK